MKQSLGTDAKYIRAGLSWDSEGRPNCDLDLSAFLLNASGKVRGDADLIFYNTDATLMSDAFIHGGDSPAGSVGDGFDETILAVLDRIDPDGDRVVFCVTVNSPARESQKFASANRAVFTAELIADPFDKEGTELCRVAIDEEYPEASGLAAFAIQRAADGGWECETVGESSTDGLAGFCAKYGLETR